MGHEDEVQSQGDDETREGGDVLPWDEQQALVLQYTPLVRRIARSMALEIPGVFDFEDAVAAGTCGLIEAVRRYHPSRGTNFNSYAAHRIRGAMVDAFRSMDRLSRTMRSRVQRADRVQAGLVAILGRNPTDEEAAEQMGLGVVEYRQAVAAARTVTVSLDRMLMRRDSSNGASDEAMQIEAVATDDELSVLLERAELRETLVTAIRGLPARDQQIVGLYYVENLSMREIARVLGVSETRISQRHAQIMRRLRTALMPLAA